MIVAGVLLPLNVPPETVHTAGLLLVKTIVKPLVTSVVALSLTGESPTTLLLNGPNEITWGVGAVFEIVKVPVL